MDIVLKILILVISIILLAIVDYYIYYRWFHPGPQFTKEEWMDDMDMIPRAKKTPAKPKPSAPAMKEKDFFAQVAKQRSKTQSEEEGVEAEPEEQHNTPDQQA